MIKTIKMSKILITGSEGNIGPYIVEAIKKNFPSFQIIRIKHGCDNSEFNGEYYRGDLKSAVFLDKIFTENNIDFVVHAASKSYSHEGYYKNPFKVIENDSALIINLLNHCHSIKKFIYISSALIYEHAQKTPILEDDSLCIPGPTSSYGVAKQFGESAVKYFSEETGIPYTIWRPFNVVSPLEPHIGEGRHVFIDFFRKLIIEQASEFRVMGTGNQKRCFIWVQDFANCVAGNLVAKLSDNQVFNIARNEPISMIELKNLLLELGRSLELIPYSYDPPTIAGNIFAGIEAEARIPSTSKALNMLGWESSTSVRECFNEFLKEKVKCL